MTNPITSLRSAIASAAAVAGRSSAALDAVTACHDALRRLGVGCVIDAAPGGGIVMRIDLDPEGTRARREPVIEGWLDGLGYGGGWDASKDYLLWSGSLLGERMADVAASIGMDPTDCADRLEALGGCPGDRGRLFRVLAARAGVGPR